MNYIQCGLLVLIITMPIHGFTADTESLAEGCAACHGLNGVSSHSDVPIIAGQPAAYISGTLKSFQEWGRPCAKSAYRHGDTSGPVTTMCKVSQGLAPDEIEALSHYYEAQKFVPAPQNFDSAKAEIGGDLHEIHCESCHTMGGTIAGRGPRLAGQWVPYLRLAFAQASTGEHLVPPVMEKRVTDFNAEEIDALLNFYASQQN